MTPPMTNERLEELRQFFLPDGYDALPLWTPKDGAECSATKT